MQEANWLAAFRTYAYDLDGGNDMRPYTCSSSRCH